MSVKISDERFDVYRNGGHVVVGIGKAPTVRVRLDPATLRALLDGRCTILRALQSRNLEVFGPTRDLSLASRAALTFIHGLVRTPEGPSQLSAIDAALRRMEIDT
ncbi:MAG: hypothetical protein H6730_06855 [Deltaproteobacteria bacterium]|nr:hypothetical protein [Deltaproteobacteria bacterium]